jgi:hypothetical protein
MAASVSRTFSTTADEIAHLTSGYAYWTFQDYRLQPENGNLPQRLASIPLLWQNPSFPAPSGLDWDTANIWRIGHAFFYTEGNDLPAMLASGRAMIACLSAMLCLVIYLWARDLFGRRGALIALLLAAFSPNLLAHGGLITSDTAAALGFTIAVFSWWRLLHRPSLGRLVVAGLCAGFLALSKYSVVLFAPIALVLLIVRLMRPGALRFRLGPRALIARGWKRVPAMTALLAGTVAVCIAVIWAGYGFRYNAAPPGSGEVDFTRSWSGVLLEVPPLDTPMILADGKSVDTSEIDRAPGALQTVIRWTRDHRLLPEGWLYGLAFVEINARGRLAYFAGEYSMTGWTSFFPTAFALKTTPPTLALLVLGTLALFLITGRRRRFWLYRVAPLLTLLFVYWSFSLLSHLNIGHRHLLPIYPAIFILAAPAILLVAKRSLWVVPVLALLVWHAWESVSIRPDYLAYFNTAAGGPHEAHRLFVDSSLDWGQDLPRLRQWVDAHGGGEKIFLSYFGSGSPRHEGLAQAIRIGDGYFDWYPRPMPPPVSGGVYCISATMLQRVYTHVRGPWSESYEDTYQRMLKWIVHVNSRPPGQPVTDLDSTVLPPDTIKDKLMIAEHLMFGRLCHFLQNRAPDARVGASFFIYRLSDQDVGFALTAPISVLNQRKRELQSTR